MRYLCHHLVAGQNTASVKKQLLVFCIVTLLSWWKQGTHKYFCPSIYLQLKTFQNTFFVAFSLYCLWNKSSPTGTLLMHVLPPENRKNLTEIMKTRQMNNYFSYIWVFARCNGWFENLGKYTCVLFVLLELSGIDWVRTNQRFASEVGTIMTWETKQMCRPYDGSFLFLFWALTLKFRWNV